MKDIKDYLHLYLGCEVMVTPPEAASFPCKLTGYVTKTTIDQNSGRVQVFEADGEDGYEGFGIRWFDEDEVELILRPLSDMTEEEFKEYAQPESFASHGGYWYACYEAIDPDFEGDVLEHINNCCDDDPELVIMCHIRSKHISYGWIEYEEKYHGLDLKEEAGWVRFLLSKGFDLFGLIEAGLAIDKTTLKQN